MVEVALFLDDRETLAGLRPLVAEHEGFFLVADLLRHAVGIAQSAIAETVVPCSQ